MSEPDPYREMKMEIARAVATGQDPTLKKFCRAFTEEFGHGPSADLIDYFQAQAGRPDDLCREAADPGDGDKPGDLEIQWCLEKPEGVGDSLDKEDGHSCEKHDTDGPEATLGRNIGVQLDDGALGLLDDQDLQAMERLSVLEQMARLIRTPLTSILGFCNLLGEADLETSSAAHVHKIEQSVDRLISGMGDFIDLYRIQDGDLQLVPVEFSLQEIADQVMTVVEPQLGAKPVDLTLQVHGETPPRLWGDGRRLRQVLTTLVGNAVKHTESGEVGLDIQVTDMDPENVQLRLVVKDTGPGMAPDQLASLFDMPRVAAKGVFRHGIHDLSLFVCRHIARRMQGDLTVASAPEGGTVIEFTLKLARADIRASEEGVPELAGKTVFLSTEESSNRLELQNFLENAQMETRSFDTPKEMFSALFASIEEGHPPRFCIWGIATPAPKVLKSAKNFGLARVLYPKLRLVGIAPPEVWEKNGDLGSLFDAVLSFPVEEGHLYGALNKINASLPANPPAEPTQASNCRILVAEDEPLHFDLIQEIFSRAGHTVKRAKSGQDLVAQYLDQPEQFDIIFTDLEMPELDGRQAVRQIRAAGYTQIPVVAISSQFEDNQRDRCLSAGINDFIAKPFRPKVLLAVLNKHLG